VKEKRMKRSKILVSTLIGVLVAASAYADKNLSIGTGATGGVYYALGGGLAKVLTDNLPGTQVTAEVTGASVDNIKFIKSGKMDIGFTMADSASDAIQGIEKFKDSKVDVRTLVALYPNHMQVITVDGTGINTLADLKGKRISTGSPGSGTEVMALRVLEAVGIDKDKDVTRERLSVNESVNAMKDRKIDAFFWVSGLPAGAVTDLAATPGVKIKLIEHAAAADAMNKKYGNLYTKGTIPANAYPGQDKPVANIQVWNLLVVDAKMPDDLAYKITKTVFDSQPDLVRVHKDASHIALKTQGPTSPIPYHPGAKKFLKEKGVTVH
jgi:TRAP transporter TAXI family solute receptor